MISKLYAAHQEGKKNTGIDLEVSGTHESRSSPVCEEHKEISTLLGFFHLKPIHLKMGHDYVHFARTKQSTACKKWDTTMYVCQNKTVYCMQESRSDYCFCRNYVGA